MAMEQLTCQPVDIYRDAAHHRNDEQGTFPQSAITLDETGHPQHSGHKQAWHDPRRDSRPLFQMK